MKSLEELKAIREKMQGQIGMRSEHATDTRVVVGMATCGIASGARPVLNTLVKEVEDRKLMSLILNEMYLELPEPNKKPKKRKQRRKIR